MPATPTLETPSPSVTTARPSAGVRAGRWRRLKTRLARGLTLPIGRFELRCTLAARAIPDPHATALDRRHAAFLRQRFPALDAYFDPSVERDPRALGAWIAFAEDAIALHHDPAREAQMRRLVHRLLPSIVDPAHRARLDDEVRRSQWRDGLVERAIPLAAKLCPTLRERHAADVAAYDHALGGRTPFLGGGVAVRDRGETLRWLFERDLARFRGKRVVHVAPEPALAAWFRSEAGVASHTTIDGFHRDVDRREDLTALSFADASVDAVICHRVLEHVPDDRAAIAEVFRVLAPGGEFSVSVPQSLHRARTTDWIVRDPGLFDHVRQYGRDFADRLRAAGFDVAREHALLDKTAEEHARDGTYPMLAYRATKPRG